MSLSGKLWPVHPHPLPNELLSSWLVRLAHANGLKVQTFCHKVFGGDWQVWMRDIDRMPPEWLIKTVCQHTGTKEKIAWQSTLAEYEGWLYPRRRLGGQLRWVTALQIKNRKHLGYGLAYCPACLAEDKEPYFRLRWRLAFYTFCPDHNILMHDRCTNCGTPVVFQRVELGKYEVSNFSPICMCHQCDFDLRKALHEPIIPYNNDAFLWLKRAHISADWHRPKRKPDMEHMNVLHQLCKVMVSVKNPLVFQKYISKKVNAPDYEIVPNRHTFESRSINERNHILQLATWIIRRPQRRISAAWEAKAIRYIDLIRDFDDAPGWYLSIIKVFNRIAL